MSLPIIPIWKEAPFIRLIIPLISGILIQWRVDLPVIIYLALIPASFISIFLFSYIKSFRKFRYYWLPGIWITLLLINIGGSITYYNDFRHYPNCITKLQQFQYTFIVTLAEPPSEKNNSFKANAVVKFVFQNDSLQFVKGNIIIYFQKDSALPQLAYNSRLAFRKKLQIINNSGNPGAFDYQQYCAFQQIYYQVYLKRSEYILLPTIDDNALNNWLFLSRKKIVHILQTYIPGDKEAGLAEALLIGYKEDLDKNLVQLYSNTGVVHIIAISGLHLGLIYWLLNSILGPLKIKGRLRWINAILVITGLWLFSFLAGGSASVCRSAVMFSFIVMGENTGRRTNIYNSLAASAFLLLCYNPFWLWDAGFQLSYIAVLSIIIFMKPLYNLLFIKNKLLDLTWKMVAISLAAQILTTPVSIFHFHQFPNYFLITNLVAVPLSSLIVLAELALCIISYSSYLSTPAGGIIFWLIKLMNTFIEHMNKMPFPITNQLQLSMGQLILIYVAIIATCIWLTHKNKQSMLGALCCICSFYLLKSYFLISATFQHKLIVYYVPHHQAIDLVSGRHSLFIADSSLCQNLPLQNFHLKPSRILYRVNNITESLTSTNTLKFFSVGSKNILIIDRDILIQPNSSACLADVIILSGDPDVTISELQKMIIFQELIFDSSNSARKINKWKVECEKAGISFHSVSEKGAFILNLN
ncbi:MAG: ComEC/Rec2 family competence protein [Chitinophagaceae bacterium]